MRPRSLAVPLALLLGVMASGVASAQTLVAPDITALPAGFSLKATATTIEEEWELKVVTADTLRDGPQVMTYMSLTQDTSEPYLWFMLNLRDAPLLYSPGGMQCQLWTHDDQLLGNSEYHTAKIATNGAIITWRQRMNFPAQSVGGTVTFQIYNGTSPNWGSFGPFYDAATKQTTTNPGPAAVSFAASRKDFKVYNPLLSVRMSRIGWQADNVGYLRLLAVRQYDNKGTLISTYTANLDVNLNPTSP